LDVSARRAVIESVLAYRHLAITESDLSWFRNRDTGNLKDLFGKSEGQEYMDRLTRRARGEQ